MEVDFEYWYYTEGFMSLSCIGCFNLEVVPSSSPGLAYLRDDLQLDTLAHRCSRGKLLFHCRS